MPVTPASADASTQLWAALRDIPVGEVLALCYAGRADEARLRLYFDVLIARGDPASAIGASIICFDLAQRGNHDAQREFEALADALRGFADRAQVAASIVGDATELRQLWEGCEAALAALDPRIGADSALRDSGGAVEIDLFDDEEFDDLDTLVVDSLDAAALDNRFRALLDDFYAGPPNRPAQDRGLFAYTREDVQRVEHFLQELRSLCEYVPAARSQLALGELFLATHLRSRSFWGRLNMQKLELLGSGLGHLASCDESLFEAAAWFGGRDAQTDGWSKVAELWLEFLAWLRHHPAPPREAAFAFAHHMVSGGGGDEGERRSTGRDELASAPRKQG